MTQLELLVQALIVGAASWRVASLFVQEEGPLGVFWRIRNRLGIDVDAIAPAGVRGFLHELFSCVWCLSVYTTPLVWLWYEAEPITATIAAAMTVVVLIQKRTMG